MTSITNASVTTTATPTTTTTSTSISINTTITKYSSACRHQLRNGIAAHRAAIGTMYAPPHCALDDVGVVQHHRNKGSS